MLTLLQKEILICINKYHGGLPEESVNLGYWHHLLTNFCLYFRRIVKIRTVSKQSTDSVIRTLNRILKNRCSIMLDNIMYNNVDDDF